MRILIPAFILLAACGSCSSGYEEESGEGGSRPPVYAGLFYPADPVELREAVDSLLDRWECVDTSESPIAGIVPHAGYVYSGETAAAFYSLLRDQQYDVVVLIGPSHRTAFQGFSIFQGNSYLTPLGRVPVADDMALRLMESHHSAAFHPSAHEEEHSLEVQLPFLQRVLDPGFQIVPIVIGTAGADELQYMAELILAEAYGRKVLVIASSDLSHYPTEELARIVDSITMEAVLSGDVMGFLRSTASAQLPSGLDTFSCGRLPIALVMAYSNLYTEMSSRALAQTTSAPVSGDYSSVVGYASIVFSTSQPDPSMWAISDEGRSYLLDIAISSVRAAAEGAEYHLPDTLPAELMVPRGAFVTLKSSGRLRGCIGTMRPIYPLVETVSSMARAAASEDPRFLPVEVTEFPGLGIEISVLTPLQILQDWRDVRVGTDGLLIVAPGGGSGVLLPQVPVEQGWNREDFLEGVSMKAGLNPDAYLGDVTLYRFQAQVFGCSGCFSED